MKHRIGYKQTSVELIDGSYAQQNIAPAASTLVTRVHSVGVTATQLVDRNDLRSWVEVVNAGSGTIYIGIADVTAATGFPLKADGRMHLDTVSEIWAVAATGTVDVRSAELSN